MRLPAVARRSPAITTPCAKRNATHVVAWGTSTERAASAGNAKGSAPTRRNSSGKLDPGSSPGVKKGMPMCGLLATLLDVRLHEVLGVRLEHVVDLVEQVVQLRLELLPLRRVRGRLLDDGVFGAGR